MLHAANVYQEYQWQQEILSRAYYPNTLPPFEMTYPAGTQVVRIQPKKSSSFVSYLDFVRQVLAHGKREADVIFSYDMHALLPAWLLSRRYNKPFVYHSHDYVDNNAPLSTSQRIYKSIERRLAPAADLVIVPDAERAQVMVEQLHLKTPPTIVANCPVYPPEQSSTALQDALQRLNLNFDKIVLRQGTIGPSHALEVTLRSMVYWASKDWAFVLLGPVKDEYRNFLQGLAEELCVQGQFVVLPALGDYRQVATYTVGAHLGHALYEPSHVSHRFITTASNKTMEYQAAGLPVLLSDTPASQELIAKYRHGVVADVRDPQAIANAINTVLLNDELAIEMSQNSFKAFSQEYNYRNQYTPVINQLIDLVPLSAT